MSDPLIRLANSNDREKILELLNDVFLENQRSTNLRELDYWKWKFEENPFGKSILMVAEINNEIVAVNNMWPWEFRFNGSTLKALQPCDSAVKSNFRGKGIFKAMRLQGLEFAKDKKYDLIFNFPNEQSLPTYTKLGWHFMGKILWWLKIIKPTQVLKYSKSSMKAEPIGIPEENNLDLELIHDLFNESDGTAAYIDVKRTDGFFKWRFNDHFSRSYGMIHCKEEENQAIAIFTVTKKGSLREMVIVDLIGSAKCTIPLFKKIIKTAKSFNVGLIAVMHNREYSTNKLWKLGFVPGKMKNMAVLPLDPGLEETAKSFLNWNLVACMHDSI